MIRWFAIAGIAIFLAAFTACHPPPPPPAAGLQKILKAGEITMITRNNAHCYYWYRDQPMGFEYDLAKAFADHLGVALKVRVSDDWDGMISDLNSGRGDFIAANLAVTPKRARQAVFSKSYMEIQPFLVVHRDNPGIHLPFDLEGKTVHVRRGAPHEDQLRELKNRGISVQVQIENEFATEELIRQVAEEKIEVTISDNNIALLSRRYFPNAVLAGPLTRKQQMSWAVHPSARHLTDRINSFFEILKATGRYAEIYNRYYAGIDHFDYPDISAYHRRLKKNLPPLLALIQPAAERHGFDWRLIAAQIYQESHFDSSAVSRAGAIGLMQLTKNTAESLGVKNAMNPQENIEAGVRYLRELYEKFSDVRGDTDRLNLALAAYNVGWGHVSDARKLAVRMDLDPNLWESIRQTLPLLAYRKYHRHATYGYCRGSEPVLYVKQITVYYDILKQRAIKFDTDTEAEALISPPAFLPPNPGERVVPFFRADGRLRPMAGENPHIIVQHK